MCRYFKGVYGLLAIWNNYLRDLFVASISFVASVAVLLAEDTLSNLLALDVDEVSKRHFFFCGLVDADITHCCKVPCYIELNKLGRIYPLRLLYYNMNACLLSAAWFGLDQLRNHAIGNLTNWELWPRVGADISCLIISSITLTAFNELSGQFGVVDDVRPFSKEGEVELRVRKMSRAISLVLEQPLPDPQPLDKCSEILSTDLEIVPCSDVDGWQGSHLGGVVLDEMPQVARDDSKVLTENERPRDDSIIDRAIDAVEDSVIELEETYSQFIFSRANKHRKILTIFTAITLFWSAISDLLGSIPSEVLIGNENLPSANADDGDDYYDGYIAGTADNELKLFALGVFYVIFSLFVLIITGELWSFLKRQDDHSETVCRFWHCIMIQYN